MKRPHCSSSSNESPFVTDGSSFYSSVKRTRGHPSISKYQYEVTYFWYEQRWPCSVLKCRRCLSTLIKQPISARELLAFQIRTMIQRSRDNVTERRCFKPTTTGEQPNICIYGSEPLINNIEKSYDLIIFLQFFFIYGNNWTPDSWLSLVIYHC